MRIRNHSLFWPRLAALLLLALCAQMLLPSQTPSAYATETSIEDFGPSLGVYPNQDYTGLYKIDAQILAHDAAQAIQAAVDLGLCESAADLELERAVPLGGETIYQLRQVYEGIPVLNRRATVLTDAQGVVRAAGGDCVPLEGIIHSPRWAGRKSRRLFRHTCAARTTWRKARLFRKKPRAPRANWPSMWTKLPRPTWPTRCTAARGKP